MSKPGWIALLLVGLAVFFGGMVAATTAGSELSRALAGTSPDEPLWMMIGGGAAVSFGLVALIGFSRTDEAR